MSFLTPLYVLGVLAVAAPIVFHLIRRTPRGEVPFSSLMFLDPVAAPADAAEPARPLLLLLLRGDGPRACWPWRSPGRSSARRPASTSATSSGGGSPC